MNNKKGSLTAKDANLPYEQISETESILIDWFIKRGKVLDAEIKVTNFNAKTGRAEAKSTLQAKVSEFIKNNFPQRSQPECNSLAVVWINRYWSA